MASVTGEAAREIAAALETCWDLLVDAAAYPEWYGTLDEVVVEEADDQGRPRTIDVRSDIRTVGSIRFRAEVAYEHHTRMSVTQTGRGELVKDLATEWVVEPLGPQQTRATYRVSVASDGLKAAAAFRTAEGLVRRHLIDGFADALKARAERSGP
jgi:uncharacterized protein YndB with AHSA1/START domain